jgi:hypothetical protein
MSVRTLTLAKGGHRYLFRYTPGRESEIIDQIMKLAEDEQSNLDWMDAAMLSFQVAHGAARDCSTALGLEPAVKPQ